MGEDTLHSSFAFHNPCCNGFGFAGLEVDGATKLTNATNSTNLHGLSSSAVFKKQSAHRRLGGQLRKGWQTYTSYSPAFTSAMELEHSILAFLNSGLTRHETYVKAAN